MTWILIIIVMGYTMQSGIGVTSIEYKTKAQCELAALVVKRKTDYLHSSHQKKMDAFCIPGQNKAKD